MFPRFIVTFAELKMKHGPPLRPLRFLQQFQTGFRGSAIALATVTRHAGTNDVFPRRFAPAVARNHVIQIKVFPIKFVTAILAGVVIALENIVARKLDLLLRHPVEEKKQDHLRHANGEGNRADHVRALVAAREAEPLIEGHGLERAAVRIDDLRVALVKEHEGALDAADVDGLPQTIEHEDVVAQDRFHGSLSIPGAGSPRQMERVSVTLGLLVSKVVNKCQPVPRYVGMTRSTIRREI
jgi:hypothetical protein